MKIKSNALEIIKKKFADLNNENSFNYFMAQASGFVVTPLIKFIFFLHLYSSNTSAEVRRPAPEVSIL